MEVVVTVDLSEADTPQQSPTTGPPDPPPTPPTNLLSSSGSERPRAAQQPRPQRLPGRLLQEIRGRRKHSEQHSPGNLLTPATESPKRPSAFLSELHQSRLLKRSRPSLTKSSTAEPTTLSPLAEEDDTPLDGTLARDLVDKAIKTGSLHKTSSSLKGVHTAPPRKRRFRLTEEALEYFQHFSHVKVRRSFPLTSIEDIEYDPDSKEPGPKVFKLLFPTHVMTLEAENRENAEDWVEKIRTAWKMWQVPVAENTRPINTRRGPSDSILSPPPLTPRIKKSAMRVIGPDETCEIDNDNLQILWRRNQISPFKCSNCRVTESSPLSLSLHEETAADTATQHLQGKADNLAGDSIGVMASNPQPPLPFQEQSAGNTTTQHNHVQENGHTMTGVEEPLFFNPNATHYSSYYTLKAKIELVGKLDKIPNGNLFNVQADLDPVRSDMCQMLRWYGVHEVGKLMAAPEILIEVQFASIEALKKFLQSKQKVETTIKEIMTVRFCTVNSQDLNASFEASTTLLLVTPNATNSTVEFRQVTLANYRNCVSLYMKSKIAELPIHPETMLTMVPEDVLTESDLPELMKQLFDVVDWYSLGLVLQIPPWKLQIIESDFPGAQVGRTKRLLSCVLVEWIQNHQEEATWSTLVHALSAIGKRPAARRIAHEYGVHIPDESVLDDLSPEKSEELQRVLAKINQLLNNKSSDQQLIQLIEDAQRKKQLTLEAVGSILKDCVDKIKMLLTQQENLKRKLLMKERQLRDEEKQIKQLRQSRRQGARKIQALENTAASLEQEVSELKQQLLETDQELTTARVKYSYELLEKSTEISALSLQTNHLICEKQTLSADISSKIMLIEDLEISNTALTRLSINLQHNLDMALQQQQQILQQEERYKHDIATLQEELQKQQKQDEEHSNTRLSHRTLNWQELLSDGALKQLASVIEMDFESNRKAPDIMCKALHNEYVMIKHSQKKWAISSTMLFKVDEDNLQILWRRNQVSPFKQMSLHRILEIREGQQTAKFGKFPYQSFSLVFEEIKKGGKYVGLTSLDLTCDSTDSFYEWTEGLRTVVPSFQANIFPFFQYDNTIIWMKQLWSCHSIDHEITERTAIKLARGFKPTLTGQGAKNIVKEAHAHQYRHTHNLSDALRWDGFVAVFNLLCGMTGRMFRLFRKYAKKYPRLGMTPEELKEFLITQCYWDHEGCTEDEIQRLIHHHDYHHRAFKKFVAQNKPSDFQTVAKLLSYAGFLSFLRSKDNSAVNVKHSDVYQDMTQPLSHYFINSSHNTYLEEDQLYGRSSIDAYVHVLLQGCRCVKIDCWDNTLRVTGLGEPIIYHGYTFTTKLPFRDVIQTIKDYAFNFSNYPVIISIENHCSMRQQDKMVQLFREVMGDVLVLENLVESQGRDRLPSPQELQGKILLKGSYRKVKGWEKQAKQGESEVYRGDEQEVTTIPNLLKLIPYCREVSIKPWDWEKQLQTTVSEMFSFGEVSANKRCESSPDKMLACSEQQLVRTYPKGIRFDSLNYDPIPLWNCGMQMVSLNWQSPDVFMHLNQGLFRRNGGCGYVLKPEVMRRPDPAGGSTPFLPTMTEPHPDVTPVDLEIELLSGQRLCFWEKKCSSLTVEIHTYGIPHDTDKMEPPATAQDNNTFWPQWREQLHVYQKKILMPELASSSFPSALPEVC